MHGTIKDMVYTKYEDEGNILRMCPGGAWTINLDEVNMDDVKLIRYITPEHIYSIYPEDALMLGFIREFQGEEKLVVPLKHWAKEKKQ